MAIKRKKPVNFGPSTRADHANIYKDIDPDSRVNSLSSNTRT